MNKQRDGGGEEGEGRDGTIPLFIVTLDTHARANNNMIKSASQQDDTQ